MSDHSADDTSFASADAAAKRDEITSDQDAVSDQDLDQAAGGVTIAKTGGDAAADAQMKNDNPESDARSF